MTEASRQHPCLIGQLVTDQPAARHGRDACRVCGLALSTGMLIASLDPAVSKTNYRPHHPIAGSKSADTNDRMRITAGETVPSAATIRHAVHLRIPTRVTQLAGRRRALRGALDEGQIVDQPHQDAGQPPRLTAAPTDPAHWLLAVDRPRLHHHASRCRRCGLAQLTKPDGRAGWSERDPAISRSYLTQGGLRQAPQAAPKVSPSETVGGEGVRRDFQAATVPCHRARLTRAGTTYRYSTIDITSRDSSSASCREIGSSSSECAPTA